MNKEKAIERDNQAKKIKELENRITFLEDYIENKEKEQEKKIEEYRKQIQELVSDMVEAAKISLNRSYADVESLMMMLVNEKILKK